MQYKRKTVVLIISTGIILIVFGIFWIKMSRKSSEEMIEIQPWYGTIKKIISTTGTVRPQNRLEVKPPISGRIEKLFVKEGQRIKTGQTLAFMSSTERAALLDAARSKGQDELDYWEDIYKPVPLISPIDGEVIDRAVEPGQTVSASTIIVVLSDRLIVKASVDETDIGKIKIGQAAEISLDAYPAETITGQVDHIAYESKLVSNVTIYEVDVLPGKIPDYFRSGMSANIDIIEKIKDDILIIPLDAVRTEKGKTYVLVSDGKGKKARKNSIETGISDEKNVEVVSGLNENDAVMVKSYVYNPRGNMHGSPFMPSRRKKKK